MQEPLLSAMPYPERQVDRNIPDPVRSPRGLLYPRWPLLSALFINVAGFLGFLLWRFAPCPVGPLSFLGFMCSSAEWPGFVQFLLIWLVFLVCWLVIFIFGYGSIEGPRRPGTPIRTFLRNASDFDAIRWLLAVYAGLASLGIIAMLLLNEVQPVPTTLATILVFVVSWIFIRRRRHAVRPLTAQEQLQLSNAATASPWYVVRSLPLIRGIFPPGPVNPGTAAPGMQPPGGGNP